jgi:hypothetical protein
VLSSRWQRAARVEIGRGVAVEVVQQIIQSKFFAYRLSVYPNASTNEKAEHSFNYVKHTAQSV